MQRTRFWNVGRCSAIGGVLSLVLSPAFASPVVYWGSDPVEPGDTVLLSGHDLRQVQEIHFKCLPSRARVSSAAECEANLKPLRQSDTALEFTVPNGFAKGPYQYELRAGSGTGNGSLNFPIVYWVQGDSGAAAVSGGWLRVVGRNIATSNNASIALTRVGSGSKSVKSEVGGTWDARFAVPKDLSSGQYEIRFWNDDLGEERAIPLGKIEIRAPSRSSEKTFDVAAFGAKGDGRTDDAGAIKRAIAAATQANGGTIYFPKGRYLLSAPIYLPPGVSVRGKSSRDVSLNWPTFSSLPPALISGCSDVSVSDVAIYAANFSSVISGGFPDASVGHVCERPGNFSVSRVVIRASAYRGHVSPDVVAARFKQGKAVPSLNGPVALRFTGTNISITDSNIYSSGSAFFFDMAKGIYVASNEFYNGWGWYSITGCDGVIFEKNVITGASPMSTGGGINTLDPRASYSQNILISQNKFSMFTSWDREAMTSDGPGGYYFGPVVTLAADRLRLAGDVVSKGNMDRPWSGAGVFVMDGAGVGQWRTVRSFANGEIVLDRPFEVVPDKTSSISIVPMQKNYIIANNVFSDTGVSAQFYGTSVNGIISGNQTVRAGGIVVRGLDYHQYQPSWYDQILGNTISDPNYYDIGDELIQPGASRIGVYSTFRGDDGPMLVRGVVVRKNTLEGDAAIDVSGAGKRRATLSDVLIENNRFLDCETHIRIGGSTEGVVSQGNHSAACN